MAMQLDIFENSRDVMLRNDVVHALEQRDAGTAGAALEILANEYPQDEYLSVLRVLTEAVAGRSQRAFPDHDALGHLQRDRPPCDCFVQSGG
jgi:hypothetical protein